jgi:hypothetical protein
MTVPKVVHIYEQEEGVYVGRNPHYGDPKWGNPFSHRAGTRAQFRVSSREEAIRRHAEWILTQPQLMAALPELRGRDLRCHCAPLPCHASTLLRLANGPIA